MAAPIVKWVCDQFSRFGIDVSEENARYILSMDDGHDLEEYMYELLDKTDPKCKKFVNELLDRWKPSSSVPGNITVYRKPEEVQDNYSGVKKKKGNSPKKKLNDSGPPGNVKQVNTSPPVINGLLELSSELQGTRIDSVSQDKSPDTQNRKQKFVPLYSQEGKARSTIQLPGRHACECQASKHNLVNNCVGCGRVVCEQEGPGPCIYCGKLVCNKGQQEILLRGSKKSEKLRQYLMGGDNREYLPSMEAKMMNGFEKALQHKDTLLEYDKTCASRTQVIDDESDYFATDSNKWLSKSDRELLRKREDEIRAKRFGSRKDRKVTLDFAGRRVLDAEEENLGYDSKDSVIQKVHYGARPKQPSNNATETGQLVNPSITQLAPKFIPQSDSLDSLNFKVGRGLSEPSSQDKRSSVRLQDKELKEMSDEGMCMSMHQPWASLLVKGIKKHEGRTWYTAHRGRLWIAATAKQPDSQDIGEVEQFYREYYNDSYLPFPSSYPVSCLLGCVEVVDCASQEDYRTKFPEGESASPYVFLCDHPQELIIKFPIKGKHKLYKLESHIHQGAKKGLRDPTIS